MSLSESLAVIGVAVGVLTFIHKLSSTPREENQRFYDSLWTLLLICIALSGLYFVYQFISGDGSPSRMEIFKFSTWGFNLIWSCNALIVTAARRQSNP
jgi:hypothetical protein